MGWHRARALLIFVLLISISTLSKTSTAAVHYVSYDGNNTAPYTTWETATFRASFAAKYCQAIDTILIAAGTYFETDSIDLSGGGTLIGVHRDSSEIVMQSSLYTLVFCEGGDLVVKNVTLKSSTGKRYEEGIVYSDIASSGSVLIDSCLFSDFYIAVFSIAGQFVATNNILDECGHEGGTVCWLGWGSGDSKFENNEFRSSDVDVRWSSFIELDINWDADSSVIRNNVFRGLSTAVHNLGLPGWLVVENNLFLSSFQAGYIPERVIISNGPYVRVSNNLFHMLSTESINRTFVHIGGYQEAHVENNTFVGALGGVAYDAAIYQYGTPPALVYVNNNQFFLNTHRPNIIKTGNSEVDSFYCEDVVDSSVDIVAVITDNICSSPMFVDTASFQLQMYSPAINAGVANLLDPDGSTSDIGPNGGPFGTSYTYLDIAPDRPRGLSGALMNDRVHLSFRKNSEADLSHYAIFRSDNPNIPLDSQHVIGYAAGQIASTYLDTFRIVFIDSALVNRSELYYTVVAVDNALLSSEPAEPIQLTLTDAEDVIEEPLPSGFQLNQNYPNPFNATTAIVYSLPNIGAQPAAVKLVIFNSIGQQVRVLVDQAQAPGRQVAYWDGNDDGGSAVASGVYFYSLKVSGVELVKKRKMMVVK